MLKAAHARTEMTSYEAVVWSRAASIVSSMVFMASSTACSACGHALSCGWQAGYEFVVRSELKFQMLPMHRLDCSWLYMKAQCQRSSSAPILGQLVMGCSGHGMGCRAKAAAAKVHLLGLR